MACEIHCDMGRIAIAAKHQKEIAELYEQEQDLEEAIKNYEIAGQYYEAENATSSSNSCYLKVALYEAQLERYEKAIDIYEKVAVSSLENSLLKWNVKDYYLNAGLCHLCTGETHTAQRALDRYQELDVTFPSTRECEFLTRLCKACEDQDVTALTTAIVDFDRVSKLSNWMTTILLRIKTSLQKKEDSII